MTKAQRNIKRKLRNLMVDCTYLTCRKTFEKGIGHE
jgi:hypothetical protein